MGKNILGKKPVKCYVWSISLRGAEMWELLKLDQKYFETFEMRCWRRMEKISWTDGVRNEEELQRVKEERNIVFTLNRRKANWIGHIFCRNCLVKRVIEGKIGGRVEVTGRRGRRCKALSDVLKEERGYSKLRERAVDRTVRRTRIGRGYGPAVRQTT
jgi:hypothetical protein